MRNVWSLICTTANNDDVRKLSWFKDHRKQIVNKRKRVSHSTCCPWWCGGTRFLKALTESRLLQCSYRQYAKNKCLSFHPSSLMMWGNSASSKISERRQKPHRHLTENKQKGHSPSSHIFSICEQTNVLCIPPFVPDDVMNFRFFKAHRTHIENSSLPHRTSKKETLTQFSYLQYEKNKQKRCCVFHPLFLMIWGTSKTQSSTRADWKIINISRT